MPLLISGPGVPRGRVVDQLVYQHSLYATTCELANVPIPAQVEFPSIAPLLHEQRTIHDAVFCRYKTMQRSIRTVPYKLIVYPQARQVQLFDLEADPWEMHNLSAQPAYAEVERELWQRLRAMQKELQDPLKLEEI
jgi:choline-sulfatase